MLIRAFIMYYFWPQKPSWLLKNPKKRSKATPGGSGIFACVARNYFRIESWGISAMVLTTIDDH